MKININSIHFDSDRKLEDFIDDISEKRELFLKPSTLFQYTTWKKKRSWQSKILCRHLWLCFGN